MGKKKNAAMVVAVVAVVASYNVYQSQNKYTLSDLAMANVEALATPEQPNVKDCIPDNRYSCESLNSTDPKKDQHRDNAVWK